jgi:methylmalonyl-CoA epimerase
MHHMPVDVDNLEQAIEELRGMGIQTIDREPRKGVSGRRIAFLHPKSTFGILIESIEHR